VVLVADHPGCEAFSEQGSLTLVNDVVLPGVGAVCAVEGVREILDTTGDDRVVVRVQEAVRVERNRVVAQSRQEEVEEQDAIAVGLEEDGLVDGVRGVVEEPVGERRAKDAGHGPTVRAVEAAAYRRATFDLLQTRLREPSPVSDTGRGGRSRCFLGSEALEEAVEALRARDVVKRQRADDDRSVAEELARERLLELDCFDRSQGHRPRPPAQGSVDDDDLLRRDDHPRALPPPDRAQRHHRANDDHTRTDHRQGPPQRQESPTDHTQQDGPRKRPHENDAVPPSLQADLLRTCEHEDAVRRE
jgi:hypothetical protein